MRCFDISNEVGDLKNCDSLCILSLISTSHIMQLISRVFEAAGDRTCE